MMSRLSSQFPFRLALFIFGLLQLVTLVLFSGRIV